MKIEFTVVGSTRDLIPIPNMQDWFFIFALAYCVFFARVDGGAGCLALVVVHIAQNLVLPAYAWLLENME